MNKTGSIISAKEKRSSELPSSLCVSSSPFLGELVGLWCLTVILNKVWNSHNHLEASSEQNVMKKEDGLGLTVKDESWKCKKLTEAEVEIEKTKE